MYSDNNNALRDIVNAHLGPKTTEASKPQFDKAKIELVFAKTALCKTIGHLTMEKYLDLVGPKPAEVSAGEQKAAEIVESYFIPLPTESINSAFARAKRESAAKLKSEIAQLKYFTYKSYSFKKKKKAPVKKLRTTNFDNVLVTKKRVSAGSGAKKRVKPTS